MPLKAADRRRRIKFQGSDRMNKTGLAGSRPSTSIRCLRGNLMRLAILLTPGLGHAVLAQENTGDQSDSKLIEEVLVTAQKRAEPLQKVPISVSVIDSETIAKRNVGDFSQFADS